jgi:hypothetical protein
MYQSTAKIVSGCIFCGGVPLPDPNKAWLDFKFSDLRWLCEAHAREFVDRSTRNDDGRIARIRKGRCKHRCLRLAYPSKGFCDTCSRRLATVQILLPDNAILGNEPLPLCYLCSERQLAVFFLYGYTIVDTCHAHEP